MANTGTGLALWLRCGEVGADTIVHHVDHLGDEFIEGVVETFLILAVASHKSVVEGLFERLSLVGVDADSTPEAELFLEGFFHLLPVHLVVVFDESLEVVGHFVFAHALIIGAGKVDFSSISTIYIFL